MANADYVPNGSDARGSLPGGMGRDASRSPGSSLFQDIPAFTPAELESTSDRHHRFSELLVSLCVGFLNRPIEQLADSLSDALRQIGEFTGADRCFLYELNDAGDEATLMHSWVAPGAPPESLDTRRFSTEPFKWEMAYVVEHGHWYVPSMDDLPEEAVGTRLMHEKLGVQSAVTVPMIVDGRLVGLLGFSHVREPRAWSDADIALTRVLAEAIVSVLERARAEEALRQSETRFREVVRDQTELITRSGPDGRLVFVNEAMCRYVQKSQEDLLGTSVLDLVHPDDLPQVRRKRAQLSIKNQVITYEHRTIRPDGTIGWHQWVKRARYDQKGRLLGFQCVGRDVTRLRQVNEELAYRRDFEGIVFALGTRFINLPPERFDAEFNDALRQVTEFTGVTRTYVYLFDTTKEEARLYDEWMVTNARPIPDAYRKLRSADFPWAMDTLLAGKTLHVPSLDALPPGAEEFREQIEGLGVKSYINVPMVVGDEVFGHFGCTCFDRAKTWSADEISLLQLLGEILINALKRRETEEALATSERRLRLTIEGIEDGLFDWNIMESHAYISDHLRRSIGLPSDQDWSFEQWESRIHREDVERVIANLDLHLTGRQPFFDAEYRFRTENRGYRWTHSRGRVVEFTPEGKPQRIVGLQRDITPQIEEREKRREQEEQIAHLGRVATMGETVAGIAHEINQPLHAASTFCAAAREAIRSDRPESRQRAMELCDRAAEQAHRAGEIIHGLRAFAKPRPTELTAVSVNELVKQTITFTNQIGKSRGVPIALELDPSDPKVHADHVQVQQVLVNLIQNACESLQAAGEPEPVVTIATRVVEGQVEVVVKDNASTPPPEEPEALFNAFYTTKPDGMGIGLSLCRTILTGLGGKIHAEANSDRGMAFKFTLPRHERAS